MLWKMKKQMDSIIQEIFRNFFKRLKMESKNWISLYQEKKKIFQKKWIINLVKRSNLFKIAEEKDLTIIEFKKILTKQLILEWETRVKLKGLEILMINSNKISTITIFWITVALFISILARRSILCKAEYNKIIYLWINYIMWKELF